MTETDFEGFTLEQLQSMIATANPSALAGYGEKLTGAAQKITTAAESLAKIARGVNDGWQGESADAFQLLAGTLVAATNGLGDYARAAGGHINHVGTQIFVAKMAMPKVDGAVLAKAGQPAPVVPPGTPPPADGVDPVKAHADAQGQVEAARREAITQMRTLASTYRVAATDLQGLPVPVFPSDNNDKHGGASLNAPGGGGPGDSGGSGGGSGGTGGGSGGSGQYSSGARSGAGSPGSGIYSAPQGFVPGGGSGGAGGGSGTVSTMPHVPQTTSLQGSGPLTGPGTTLDPSWMPQVTGGGPGAGPPGANGPSGGTPGSVPPYSGNNPFTSPGGGGGGRSNSAPGSVPGTRGPGGMGPRGGGGSIPGTTPGGTPGPGGGRGTFSARPEAHGPGPVGPGGTSATGSPVAPRECRVPPASAVLRPDNRRAPDPGAGWRRHKAAP